MIQNTINKIREDRLTLISYDLDIVLNSIKNNINNNIDILKESYKHEYNIELDENRLYESFDLISLENESYKNEYGIVSNTYSPYGIVGLIIDNEISLYNLASILSLIIQSKNSCILEVNKEIGTFNILVEIINQVLIEEDIPSLVIKNDLRSCDEYDLLIFIGEKNEFNKLNNKCEKKYYGIGNYELIIDYELDKELIKEAEKQNVKITYKNKNKYFYNNYNNISNNYCVSLMTDSKEEARIFLKNMKASFLLVNMLPTLESRINIEINDLVYKKSSIVYEE